MSVTFTHRSGMVSVWNIKNDKSIGTIPVIVEVQDQMCLGAALIRNRRSANNPADAQKHQFSVSLISTQQIDSGHLVFLLAILCLYPVIFSSYLPWTLSSVTLLVLCAPPPLTISFHPGNQ